jgi:hypothetical protein
LECRSHSSPPCKFATPASALSAFGDAHSSNTRLSYAGINISWPEICSQRVPSVSLLRASAARAPGFGLEARCSWSMQSSTEMRENALEQPNARSLSLSLGHKYCMLVLSPHHAPCWRTAKPFCRFCHEKVTDCDWCFSPMIMQTALQHFVKICYILPNKISRAT